MNPDNSITVEDDGRGIPIDIHKTEKVSAAEVIMTQLHAGGKFDHDSYKVSGGLHGVGVSVVHALSKNLKLSIYRDDNEYFIEFSDGKSLKPLKSLEKQKRGTSITFTFQKYFHLLNLAQQCCKRMRELAFLNKGNLTLYDKSSSQEKNLKINMMVGFLSC